LVAIAIPVFTTRLEQSRETADIANLRSAYAAAQVAALSGDKDGKPMKDGVSYYYDANDDIGLKEGAKPANGIGKGTATEGKADSSALPSMVSYKGSSDVRSQFIKVTYESGKVSKVVFSN
jgi:type IV pilus assembly protein PilA